MELHLELCDPTLYTDVCFVTLVSGCHPDPQVRGSRRGL